MEPANTSNAIFSPSFHTLQTHLAHNDQLLPVMVLGTDDSIVVSFDELSDDRRYMRYELIHCDSRWRPDGLVAPEFLDGFNEGVVDDYAFSQATTTHYVNYRIVLPNKDMQLRLSGNYLLRVYDENDPDKTLLQTRFSVVEPMVKIRGSVSSRTDMDYNDAHQQLTLEIDAEGMPVHNMYSDLRVVVVQNGRKDNAVHLSVPTRVSGSTAVFEHDRNLIFPAGNEYRRMEIISVTYPGMGVDELGYMHPFYHATLYCDTPRNEQSYTYDRTQHGRFRIREFNSDDSDVEADYMLTHFALDIPELVNADVFIDGDMTLRSFDPASRMVYNRATGRYELAMLLKQGAYNYQYLTVPHGSMRGNTANIEGDFYQTSNEYTVYVYYRALGQRYDRLVGTAMLFSGV